MNGNAPRQETGERLDRALFARGIARSRSAAADLIQRGKVRVNGAVTTKASKEVMPSDVVQADQDVSYVSRAGEKLAHALREFGIDPAGLTAIDIGSSTGGFADCLLQKGAARVIAVDVGTGQLAQSLRDDPRVEAHESTDIRSFEPASPADLAVIDVSFISLEHILPKAFELLKKGGRTVALVKPQFEVGKEAADRAKGVITDPAEQAHALEAVKKIAQKAGFKVAAETASPIEGEKGNKEFLLYLTR
ncbi:MAG TPA: TlyA family RNA methyltransferase [Candidatus Paceibacterota bacterium]|nr:TlyA family RNA methyltransferase [Candidatus Paceibacterota bacterium]